MKRTYTKTTWVNNKTPLDASNLNNIESGIEGLYSDALSLSNFTEGPGISIEALEGGDVKLSLKLRRLLELPENGDGGQPGDYYKDENSGYLYFCLSSGTWVKILYENF